MFTNDIARKVATIVCTALFSATCVAGAVGPAAGHHASGQQSTVTATRQMA